MISTTALRYVSPPLYSVATAMSFYLIGADIGIREYKYTALTRPLSLFLFLRDYISPHVTKYIITPPPILPFLIFN